MSNSESKYDKNTYIGYLKLFNGGMKVIPGDIDNKIIHNRDRIIDHLNLVLSGGKQLKEKNVEKYFKALGGKYIRSKMNLPESTNVKGGSNKTISSAHKLLKLASKNNFNISNVLDIFKGSAPQLYEKLETKISGGQVRYTGSVYSNSSRRSSYESNRGGNNSISTKPKPSNAALQTFATYANNYTADFRNINERLGRDPSAEFSTEFFNANEKIRDEVLNNLETSLRTGQTRFTTQNGQLPRTSKDAMAFFNAFESSYMNDPSRVGKNNVLVRKYRDILVDTKWKSTTGEILGKEFSKNGIMQYLIESYPTIYNNAKNILSKGGYDDYRRDSYRSNSSRRNSYESNRGGYDSRRNSYRSEGGYDNYKRDDYRRDSYRLEGGDEIKTFRSTHTVGSGYGNINYAEYFRNNIEYAIRLANEFEDKRNIMIKFADALIYAAAINAVWVNTQNPMEKARMKLLAKNLSKYIDFSNENNIRLDKNDARNSIAKVAEGVFNWIDNIPWKSDRNYNKSGGYDNYRHNYNRGGMYKEEEEENEGGYDNYNYNRGSMNYNDNEGGYRDRYYSDNMHGGALGQFRNEIGRNLFNNNVNKLRENILKIELD